MFGLHWGLIPSIINNFTDNRLDTMIRCGTAIVKLESGGLGVFLWTMHRKMVAGSAALMVVSPDRDMASIARDALRYQPP